jgi:hypothetical protein
MKADFEEILITVATYPETNIIDPHAFLQQLVCKSQLPKRLNGLGLQSICSSRRRFICTIIDDLNIDSKAGQI